MSFTGETLKITELCKRFFYFSYSVLKVKLLIYTQICKGRYFKPLSVISLMIIGTANETPKSTPPILNNIWYMVIRDYLLQSFLHSPDVYITMEYKNQGQTVSWGNLLHTVICLNTLMISTRHIP